MTAHATHIARDLGITYRQIDYWERSGLLGPARTPGSGYVREFSKDERATAVMIRDLLAAGFTLKAAANLAARMIADPYTTEIELGPALYLVNDRPIE